MNLIGYRDRRWYDKRLSIIKRDNYTCAHCHNSFPISELQVHHQTYIKGKHPWDYEDYHLITLCKGCHAGRHNHNRSQGWTYEGMYDLEEPIGTCDSCGTTIRYEHYISHPIYGFMTVGSQCAEKLTEFYGLSEKEREAKRISDKLKRYMDSPRWKIIKKGKGLLYKWDDYRIFIWDNKGKYNIQIGFPLWHKKEKYKTRKVLSIKTKNFPTLEDAKRKAFEILIEDYNIGLMNKHLEKKYPDFTPYPPFWESNYD